MRAFPKPLAVVALAALAGTACRPQPAIKAPAPEFADLVLHGGKVVTVDSDLGASAFGSRESENPMPPGLWTGG